MTSITLYTGIASNHAEASESGILMEEYGISLFPTEKNGHEVADAACEEDDAIFPMVLAIEIDPITELDNLVQPDDGDIEYILKRAISPEEITVPCLVGVSGNYYNRVKIPLSEEQLRNLKETGSLTNISASINAPFVSNEAILDWHDEPDNIVIISAPVKNLSFKDLTHDLGDGSPANLFAQENFAHYRGGLLSSDVQVFLDINRDVLVALEDYDQGNKPVL